MPDIWLFLSIPLKFLTYLGVLASFGLVLTCAVFHRETCHMRSRLYRPASAFAILAISASVLGFAVRGAGLLGSVRGLVDPEMIGILWNTSARTEILLRCLGMALVVIGLSVPGVGLWIAGAGGAAALWSFASVGHVAEAEPFWLSLVLLLHLAAAAIWIGILLPLQRLARDDLLAAAALGIRFGKLAGVIVPGLVLAGLVMAWILLGNVSVLVGSAYGIMLLAKIGCVTVLLGAAAMNKLRFVPAMQKGDRAAATRLRQSIGLEWITFSAILLATAILTGLFGPPGQAHG